MHTVCAQGIFDNAPAGVKFTNKQLWELLDPTNEHLPYVYEQFEVWGDMNWDPLALSKA